MRARRHRYDNTIPSYYLQLTSMVDMLTILLVYLLKSFSSSSVYIPTEKDLRLPASVSQQAPMEALKLKISKTGIYVEDKKIADLDGGKIPDSLVDKNDPQFVTALFQELDEKYKQRAKEDEDTQILEKQSDIDPVNGTNFVQNEQDKSEKEKVSQVIMQADSSLPYVTLKKIMYTSSMAGFTNLKMATLSLE